MAVKLIDKIFRWQCLSSDDKPTSGVTEGSMVHVVDTGEEYVFHDGIWVDDLRRIYALQNAV